MPKPLDFNRDTYARKNLLPHLASKETVTPKNVIVKEYTHDSLLNGLTINKHVDNVEDIGHKNIHCSIKFIIYKGNGIKEISFFHPYKLLILLSEIINAGLVNSYNNIYLKYKVRLVYIYKYISTRYSYPILHNNKELIKKLFDINITQLPFNLDNMDIHYVKTVSLLNYDSLYAIVYNMLEGCRSPIYIYRDYLESIINYNIKFFNGNINDFVHIYYTYLNGEFVLLISHGNLDMADSTSVIHVIRYAGYNIKHERIITTVKNKKIERKYYVEEKIHTLKFKGKYLANISTED